MKLLISEEPIPLLPSLATKVGLNAAIFLQQLHYRTNISKNIRDGHKWVFNTYDDWMEEFPFWSLNTIKRITYDLEQKGYLISTSKHNRMKIDNTKWYRIDYDKLPFSYDLNEKSEDPKLDAPSSQHETIVNPQLDAVQTHSETTAYSTLGRSITKELKNLNNKTLVEKNLDVAHSVIQYLNDQTGKHFKAESAATRKFINGRIKEGYTEDDFIRVIDHKTKQWLNNRELSAYLRPSTLFNATNFENYINELVIVKEPKIDIYVPPVLDFDSGEGLSDR